MFIKNICALVILTPEDTKISEFKSGTWKGLRGSTPLHGQMFPTSTEGLNAKWKKDQKKEKKNITSEIINNIIPNLIICWTLTVCEPWPVLSRTTSRAHIYMTQRKLNTDF